MSPPLSQRRELGACLRSVVKVMCVSDNPDYEQPWQTHGPTSSFGSGAVIETAHGLRVLTNAHCVANHVFVEVRRYGKSQKYVAEVEAIGHECDLALLSVDDDFFAGTAPILLGPMPELSDRVSVCGFPIGGERLSITEGVVSRIELVHYAQSQRELLAVQIDAAINAGNSGGPVLNKDGRLVGVAFQALDEAAQIGYMIAPPVVEHFLADVENGIHEGFPSLGVRTQPLESEAHRRSLGLPSRRLGGVLITRVVVGGSADGVLCAGDVLLEIGGVAIDDDGTVVLREGELVDYRYVVSECHVGERVRVSVWRDRTRLDLEVVLRSPRRLVSEERYDVRPSYFIVGGLVLVPLTRDYLGTWGESWQQNAPRELVALYETGVPTPDRDQVVLLQKVLADRINQGYHDHTSLIVEAFNGVRVRNLEHLVRMVEACDDEFLRFETQTGLVLVIERARAHEREAAILQRYGVPADRSLDLRLPADSSPRATRAPVTSVSGLRESSLLPEPAIAAMPDAPA